MAGVFHRIAAGSLALALAGSVAAQAPPQSGAKPKTRKASKPSASQQAQPPVQMQAPPQPVIPPRPEQLPPIVPKVTYQNGELTIIAQNSTLSSILAAVKARTGAQVEVPPEAANDRVVVQLGPAGPRDVIAALLQGSRFDYIVMGSANDPNALSQVILTARRGGGPTAVSSGSQPGLPSGGANQPQGPPGAFRGGVSRPEMNAEEEEPTVEAQPEPPPVQPERGQPTPGAMNPPGQPGFYQPGVNQPGMVGPPNVQPGTGTQNPQGAPGQATPGQTTPGNPNQVKTPEQLLQELQRMQQQQQQPATPQDQPQQQQQRPPQDEN